MSELESLELYQQLDQYLKTWLEGAHLSLQSPPELAPMRLALLAPEALKRRFTEAECAVISERPAYWSQLWPAGWAMARALLQSPDWVCGKRVIEVGCGCGAVGIAAAKAGAASVLAVDLDPLALAAAELNASINGVSVDTQTQIPSGQTWDVLLAADVLYDPANRAHLEPWQTLAQQLILAESRGAIPLLPHLIDLGVWQGQHWPDIDPLPQHQRVHVVRIG